MVITRGTATSSAGFIEVSALNEEIPDVSLSGRGVSYLSRRVERLRRYFNSSDKLANDVHILELSGVNDLVNYTDEELIELIVKKDHAAFSELVRRYSDKFYSTAFRIMMNRADSEDMVQEAFLKLWNEPGLWDESYNTRFTTWFYRVIINQCLDFKRKKSYRNHEEYRETLSERFNTDDIIEKKSKSELINSCIAELPERQQIALNLFYYENLSINEAAEIMELKPKGMESLVLRAKENLRSRLKEYHEQEAI